MLRTHLTGKQQQQQLQQQQQQQQKYLEIFFLFPVTLVK